MHHHIVLLYCTAEREGGEIDRERGREEEREGEREGDRKRERDKHHS